MYVNEYSFDHLRQADDARFSRELEFRRLARERNAARVPIKRKGLRERVQHLFHPAYPSTRHLSHT